jgi:hypothetical protein
VVRGVRWLGLGNWKHPNGDSWFLGREPADGHAFIIHQPNGPSVVASLTLSLSEFLRDAKGLEQQALLRLISLLVDVPPFATNAERIHELEKQVGDLKTHENEGADDHD